MGRGSWSDRDYDRVNFLRASTGKSAFAYTDHDMAHKERSEWRTHPQMNPKGITRESRDSATHPQSLAIAVEADVTGSMADTPRIFQKRLPSLMGLLLRKNYVENPQILFGAIGDATCDQAPLQIGQFESDITMESDLGRLLLEAGGGGHVTESYELAIYFTARHTAIDCWEKRKKKGYLFLSGDETPYPFVKKAEVKEIIGDDLNENIAVDAIIAETKEKYHVFMLRPLTTSWGADLKLRDRWIALLGEENVIQLEKPEAISETIALIIGLTEGKITLDEGIADLKELKEANLSEAVIESIRKSLVNVPSNKSKTAPKAGTSTKPDNKDTVDKNPRVKPGRI